MHLDEVPNPAAATDEAADKTLPRRRFLQAGAAIAGSTAALSIAAPRIATAANQSASAAGYRTRLALLGTAGGPPPMTGRSGICSAIVVGDDAYIVDLGHGSYKQIASRGFPARSIKTILLTHLHSDHVADLYQLIWLRYGGGIGSLPGPFDVYGPGQAGGLPESHSGQAVATVTPESPTPGTVAFINKSIEASAYDLNVRMRDQGRPDIRSVLRPHDIALPDVGASATGNLWPDMEPFTVFENDDVKVSATLVQHPPVFPSFAFRFDTDDGSAVFSGDTSVSDNLVRLAQGADTLVHEVIDLDWVGRQNVSDSLLNHLAESHTDVNKVGAIAERAGVRRLVLNHLVPGDTAAVNDGQWQRRAQSGFSGEVVVGRDLMQLGIGTPSGPR